MRAPAPIAAVLAPALALALALGLAAPPASAQGQWMDVGSGATYTIRAENDPSSFERFPPYAFGDYPAGDPNNLVWAELLPWPCSALPSTAICSSGRFVAAYNADLDTGTCPCSGILFQPVHLELGYNPSTVANLGVREEDLVLALYDNEFGEWVELPEHSVVPIRDVVTGSHQWHARQYYAVLVREGEDESTWGRIKVQWRR